MTGHEAWHVLVLGSTLLAAAGAAILVLSSVVFDVPPSGLQRARAGVLALIIGAALLLVVEWFVVH